MKPAKVSSRQSAERKSLVMKLAEATVLYGILFLFAILVGIPFLYMITGSFKTNGPAIHLSDQFAGAGANL